MKKEPCLIEVSIRNNLIEEGASKDIIREFHKYGTYYITMTNGDKYIAHKLQHLSNGFLGIMMNDHQAYREIELNMKHIVSFEVVISGDKVSK